MPEGDKSELVETTSKGMPQFGASGRKIVYDENGKP